MTSLVSKLRPDRTKTQRLSKGHSVDRTPERTPPCQPGQQSIREVLELLYTNPDEEGATDVPSLLLEGQPAPRRKASPAGITVLPWEMFLREPDRLKDILHLGADHHISYNKDNVNALFRATYMDNPAFGDISGQGDAWVITVESIRELGKLRTLMTGRVSVLGMSIARYTSRWRTANRVPCLLMIDPDDDSVRETLDSAFNEAELSMNAGKNFSFQVDLNRCVETWCRVALGARCQSLGAKIVVTSGEPHQPVLSRDRILCCVLCLPLWGVQSCLYQIQRKSLYDDSDITPNLDVRLHDGGWVKQERRSTIETSEDSGCPSPKHNRGKSNCKPKDETMEAGNISEARLSVETKETTAGSNVSRKSPRLRKRKEKRTPRLSRRNGEENSGFEMAEDSTTSGSTPSPVHRGDIRQVEPQGFGSDQQTSHRPGFASRVVTSEMLLTGSVELTKFTKLYEKGNMEVETQQNGVEDAASPDNGSGSTPRKPFESPVCKSPINVDSGNHNGLNTHVQRFKNQQNRQQRMFVRSESGSDVSADIWDMDSGTDSTSSDMTSTSPCDSAASDGKIQYFKNGLKLKKDKHGRILDKPRSILKEFRKTTDGTLGRLMGNGIDEYARSKPVPERPSTAIPGERRSVHFDDEKYKKVPSKSHKSWLTDDAKPNSEKPQVVASKQPSEPSTNRNSREEKAGLTQEQKERPSPEAVKTSTAPAAGSAPVADGMLTNAWSFSSKVKPKANAAKVAVVPKSPSTPKSFLRPKAKVVFSTDEEDSDVDWRSSASRLIVVDGPGKNCIFDSTDLEKDTETDTEISHFRLEDVDDQEVNYLSDSHISVPSSRHVNKSSNQKSKSKRNFGNFRRHQGANLPRKRLYNPKKQSLSMLSLNVLDL